MKLKITLLALALGASTCIMVAQDSTPPAASQPGGPAGRPGRNGRAGGWHLLPPRAQDQLNLTPDQQKQIADLETEVKGKLAKILTADQMEQLKNMRPPGRQGQGRPEGGPGGPGGPDGGQGGPDGANRPQRPPSDN